MFLEVYNRRNYQRKASRKKVELVIADLMTLLKRQWNWQYEAIIVLIGQSYQLLALRAVLMCLDTGMSIKEELFRWPAPKSGTNL